MFLVSQRSPQDESARFLLGETLWPLAVRNLFTTGDTHFTKEIAEHFLRSSSACPNFSGLLTAVSQFRQFNIAFVSYSRL